MCEYAVVIPTVYKQDKIRGKILRELGKCIFFFSGIDSINIYSRKNHPPPCNFHFNVNNINASTKIINDNYITLPVVESYFNLGLKLVNMIQWISNRNTDIVLYIDMDMAENLSKSKLTKMLHEIKKNNGVVGDILDCLTPANQLCCCNSVYHFSSFYNLSSPYKIAPPMMWGGGGIGFNRETIQKMLLFTPKIHYTSDQTLSYWANQAGIRFHQASWSNKHDKWCNINTGLNSQIEKKDEYSWSCFSKSKIHNFDLNKHYKCLFDYNSKIKTI